MVDDICDILDETVMQSAEHEHCLFQKDGSPPQYAATREILHRDLQNRWVGIRDLIEWPARSPDLTACDHWLWGYLKERIFDHSGYTFRYTYLLRLISS